MRGVVSTAERVSFPRAKEGDKVISFVVTGDGIGLVSTKDKSVYINVEPLAAGFCLPVTTTCSLCVLSARLFLV